jgi:tripartite-type tricarboxylate transporter receptor subunit TctC
MGVDMVHVAYKGSAAYINDLIGGQVPAAIDTVADLSELHRAGRIRILATTGAARAPRRPTCRPFTELGLKNVGRTGWFGFFAPANTPKTVIDTLNRGINKALSSPDVVERLTKLGMDPATSTPDEFARIVASDYAKGGRS